MSSAQIMIFCYDKTGDCSYKKGKGVKLPETIFQKNNLKNKSRPVLWRQESNNELGGVAVC